MAKPPTTFDAVRSNAETGVLTWTDPDVQLRSVDPALTLPAFVLIDSRHDAGASGDDQPRPGRLA